MSGGAGERGRPIQEQVWSRLLFLHWPFPAEAVRPLLPRGLELDLRDGVAWVGLIPFRIDLLRPLLVPRWLGLRFLETNLRTYVTVGGKDPGIFFFSLDASSRLAVLGARAGFGLPYFHARMRMEEGDGLVEYGLRRRFAPEPRLDLRYRIGAPLPPALPGSMEEFLIERYVLHVKRRGRLWTCRVRHRPYPLHAAEVLAFEQHLLFTAAILPDPTGPAPVVHFSPGVEVMIEAPWRR